MLDGTLSLPLSGRYRAAKSEPRNNRPLGSSSQLFADRVAYFRQWVFFGDFQPTSYCRVLFLSVLRHCYCQFCT